MPTAHVRRRAPPVVRAHVRTAERRWTPLSGGGGWLRGDHAPARTDTTKGPAQRARTSHVQLDQVADRGVQPREQLHLGVLGSPQLCHRGVPLGERQSLGLLLEVVEEVEDALLPAHRRTLTEPAVAVSTGPPAGSTAHATFT